MKILIVEDDKGISDFIVPELEHEGYTTCLAETGRKALDLFESEKPDLILLDIMLPELNGLEVLRSSRSASLPSSSLSSRARFSAVLSPFCVE